MPKTCLFDSINHSHTWADVFKCLVIGVKQEQFVSLMFLCYVVGISVGCTDVYKHTLDCQWIDITDLPAGQYAFKVRLTNCTHLLYNENVKELSSFIAVSATPKYTLYSLVICINIAHQLVTQGMIRYDKADIAAKCSKQAILN